jgi:hypothetical protein
MPKKKKKSAGDKCPGRTKKGRIKTGYRVKKGHSCPVKA